MKRFVGALFTVFVFAAAACTPAPDVPATVDAAVQATLAAQPPPSPATVVVAVPETVVVPQTVVVTATPQPTATVAPGTAAAAQPPVAGGTPVVATGPDPLAGTTGVIFEEGFLIPAFWGLGEDEQAHIFTENGRLVIVNKQPQQFVWTYGGVKARDFYVQAVVQPVNCKNSDNYGIMFRATDDSNLDLFGISCDGRYRLLEVSGGRYLPVVDWTASEHILPFDQVNTLGVRAEGNQISLYVNNVYLTTATGAANSAGRFGLYVGNVALPDLTVGFDDVTAWRIGP